MHDDEQKQPPELSDRLQVELARFATTNRGVLGIAEDSHVLCVELHGGGDYTVRAWTCGPTPASATALFWLPGFTLPAAADPAQVMQLVDDERERQQQQRLERLR